MPRKPETPLPGADALRQMAEQDGSGLFAPQQPDPACAGLFLNRELSWLAFNRRVMQEAADTRLPLYDRLRFLSIYCSNLDEFYMVRVGGLVDRDLLRPWRAEPLTGLTPREQIDRILAETARQKKEFEPLYREVAAGLAAQGVELLDFARIDPVDELLAKKYFDELQPLLSPQVIGRGHPFPFLRNKEQYVLALFRGKDGAGIVPVTRLPKFFVIRVEGVQKIALTAELVRHFVKKLFPKQTVAETTILRITRNAEISAGDVMDDCDADFRAVMERLLRRRRRLEPVRAQLAGKPSDRMLEFVCAQLDLPKKCVFSSRVPLDLSFVLALPEAVELSALRAALPEPAKNVALKKGDYFGYLARHDLLIALPYQSINPFVDLLYEAADDPNVTSIQITLYRLAGSSRIAAALAYAADRGKQVTCLLELRARFDEQNNIDYSRMLEEAGCTILYGLTEYKVHTKLCLITRRVPGGVQYYTQVGTGNYNEATAEQYTDLMLLTSDPAVGRDAAKAFRALAVGETVGETETLWIAPEGYKSRLLALIDEQTALGSAGYLAIKVNSMNDADVMRRLVRASGAGVTVELFVRGICCLCPGVPERTEHITVRSIIGRYLEHERIFVFGRGTAQRVFIGSGDLLERNTMRRIEAFTEVKTPETREEVLAILDSMRRDNCKAWLMQPDGGYVRAQPEGEPFVSQENLHAYFAGRTVRKPEPPAQQKPPAPQKKLSWWRRLLKWLKEN